MYSAHSTTGLIALINADYSFNSRTLSPLAPIARIIEDNLGSVFGDELQAYIDNIQGKIHAFNVGTQLKALAKKVSVLNDSAITNDLSELGERSCYRSKELPHAEHGRKFLPKADVESYILNLDTSIAKVASFLAVSAGLKRGELFADVDNIVSGKLNINGRSVEYDPWFLVEDLQVVNGALDVFKSYLKKSGGNAAIAGKECSSLDGLPYTLGELRDSYTVHQLKDGKSYEEVAELLGVGSEHLKGHLQPFISENNINL